MKSQLHNFNCQVKLKREFNQFNSKEYKMLSINAVKFEYQLSLFSTILLIINLKANKQSYKLFK